MYDYDSYFCLILIGYDYISSNVDYFDLQCFLQSDITFYIILCIRFIILGKRFLITDVAMTIHVFLKDVDADADADTKQQLQRLCNLIEDCIS